MARALKTIIYQGRRVRAPKFKLGDRVRIEGLKSVGKISFNSGFDDHLNTWFYKVAFGDSRRTFSEKSIIKVSAHKR